GVAAVVDAARDEFGHYPRKHTVSVKQQACIVLTTIASTTRGEAAAEGRR
ncbi:unnamed protein product, partial [Ectocarpus sp. 13 AM-2016]